MHYFSNCMQHYGNDQTKQNMRQTKYVVTVDVLYREKHLCEYKWPWFVNQYSWLLLFHLTHDMSISGTVFTCCIISAALYLFIYFFNKWNLFAACTGIITWAAVDPHHAPSLSALSLLALYFLRKPVWQAWYQISLLSSSTFLQNKRGGRGGS